MVGSSQSSLVAAHSSDSLDDAEKGMYDSTVELTAPLPVVFMDQGKARNGNNRVLPTSTVYEGILPLSNTPGLSEKRLTDTRVLDITDIKKPTSSKPEISRWVLFDLWFNTYRKFFTFVVLLNLTGIIMAALGRFHYAENHLGALVLGNLLTAILMRNELWMRFLYMVAIYGLRSVRPLHH
jgi:hypothetical protein